MAFAMTTLRRLKSGAFTARKSIPKDVRDEYRKLFGGGWEERFYADAGTSLSEAKRALNDWLAEIEGRIKAIRDAAAGNGRSLTRREALALAGEWYLWFVAKYEDDPGDPVGWEELLSDMQSLCLNARLPGFARTRAATLTGDGFRTRTSGLRCDRSLQIRRRRHSSWPAEVLR
jgi:hypothetical protein